MTDQLHPGSHPDAELLSAFVEGALPEHERMNCLAHFSECERCREIIFLAQPAKPLEAVKVVPARRGWSRPLPIFAATLATAALLALLIMPRQGKLQAPVPAPLRAEIERNQMPSVKTLEPAQERGAEPPPPADRSAKPHLPEFMARSEKVPPPPPLFPSPAEKTTMLATPDAAPVTSAAPAPSPPAAPIASAAMPQLRAFGRVLGKPGAASSSSLSKVNGSVHDPSGQAISGATVNLQPLSGGVNAHARTNAAGEFTLAALPPGKYELQVESSGFQREDTLVELKPGEVASLDSTLKVGSAAQTVEVSAAALQMDTTTAEIVSGLPVGFVTTVKNGAHSVALDGRGKLFYRKGGAKNWKAVKPKWQGKVTQVVLINDRNALFQLTTDRGEFWLSPDGSHWHLASSEKK